MSLLPAISRDKHQQCIFTDLYHNICIGNKLARFRAIKQKNYRAKQANFFNAFFQNVSQQCPKIFGGTFHPLKNQETE
jgi:hypothetical protein